ncbi:hypothetical protein DVH05_004426 [Phytophthora capsici]|nr:hypothetical protein DVH05_004426 [Phytophthora capsici]
MIAFLESGALALDAQLRAKVLSLAPHYTVKNGILMRRVHLKARAGPARSLEVPVIPITYVATVLHHCHADVFAAHVGVTKTLDKVRKHAYWHGWKKDVAEYVRECTVCGSGKGYRPWRNGLMQKMPIQELTGTRVCDIAISGFQAKSCCLSTMCVCMDILGAETRLRAYGMYRSCGVICWFVDSSFACL